MFEYNSIPEALEALRNGEIIMVTDDEDRENEGDFICAAEFATTDNINFMATHAKGLICMPMSEEFVKKLQIPQMVTENTDNHETAFTVSIDHVSTKTGNFCRRAQHYRLKVRGRQLKAQGLPQTGAYVPSPRQEKRCSRTERTH